MGNATRLKKDRTVRTVRRVIAVVTDSAKEMRIIPIVRSTVLRLIAATVFAKEGRRLRIVRKTAGARVMTSAKTAIHAQLINVIHKDSAAVPGPLADLVTDVVVRIVRPKTIPTAAYQRARNAILTASAAMANAVQGNAGNLCFRKFFLSETQGGAGY